MSLLERDYKRLQVMCGISGIIDWHSEVDPNILHNMRESMIHRGPDDAGLWIRIKGPPFVGLAHRRLSIIDLSESARQPMHYDDGNLVVVFNGEIYNYIELRHELEKFGCRFTTNSDTEVLLAAFSEWGTDCLRRFNGMFAFAIWDERQESLFAARDRFGKKPFFYHYRNGCFHFASEMKALFRVPTINCRPDPVSLSSYADSFTIENGKQTMFEGISRLRPSEALLLSRNGNLRRWRYWKLEPNLPAGKYDLKRASEEFVELFTDSVRIRLRADVPVGSSLSGGLDSSAIVCTMARQIESAGGGNLKTFSARFPDTPAVDEGEYIDAVVRKAYVQAYQTSPAADDLKRLIRRVHYYQEEPFLSSSIFSQWEVMRLAHRENVTILLDGQGGDEILAGYIPYFLLYFLDLLLSARWHTLVLEVVPFLAMQYRAMRRYPNHSQRFYTLTPFSLANAWMARTRRRASKFISRPVFSQQNEEENPFKDRLTRRLYRDLTLTSIPQLLRYADRNAMAFSREIRNPFLDYRLVEYLFSLPADLKIRHGWNKFLLRKALQGIIPNNVRTRFDKVGYATPESQWLRGPLRDWAESILFGDTLRELACYPILEVRRYWEGHQSGKHDNRWKLWPWLSLSIWLTMIQNGSFGSGSPPGE